MAVKCPDFERVFEQAAAKQVLQLVSLLKEYATSGCLLMPEHREKVAWLLHKLAGVPFPVEGHLAADKVGWVNLQANKLYLLSQQTHAISTAVTGWCCLCFLAAASK